MKTGISSSIKKLAKAIVIIVCVWAAGLLIFSLTLPTETDANALEPADGIVVLTGGKGRLEAGFMLLTQDKGRRLLVSGVHQSVGDQDLIRRTNGTPDLFDCCVDLDRISVNTIDNALETAKWARDHDFKRLYVVTSDYHMHRSKLLLEAAMPNSEILPYPVEASISFEGLVIEYAKFIVTYARTALSV